jgi:hypothetical protein
VYHVEWRSEGVGLDGADVRISFDLVPDPTGEIALDVDPGAILEGAARAEALCKR